MKRTDPGRRCETYLGGQDQRSQKHTFASPLLRPDGKVRLCAVNVDERCEYDGSFHLGARKDAGHEFGEVGLAIDIFGIWVAGGGDAAECKVYGFYSALNDIV